MEGAFSIDGEEDKCIYSYKLAYLKGRIKICCDLKLTSSGLLHRVVLKG
jgi:hypothetical protein